MTIRIQADHKTEGVRHRWFPDSRFGTLIFGQDGLGNRLYFDSTDDVDAVIAELAALRAEMTGACGNIAPHTGLPCTETGEHERHRNGMVVWGPGVTEPAQAEPVYPEPGSTIPPHENFGMEGYVVGICGHRVAGSEWRAGFRTCERCPVVTAANLDETPASAAS